MKNIRRPRVLIGIGVAVAAMVVYGVTQDPEPVAPPAPAAAPVTATATAMPPPPVPAPAAEPARGPSDTERAEAVTRENQIAYVAGLRVYANYDYAADGSDNPKYVIRDAVRLCDYIDAGEGDPVIHATRRFKTDEQRAAAIVEYTVENFCTIPGVRKG